METKLPRQGTESTAWLQIERGTAKDEPFAGLRNPQYLIIGCQSV